jgi:uncharacterized membrane protein YdbT with pleckstrin-like domain
MNYIEDSLNPGEKIMLRARLAWAIFIVPVILIVGAFIYSFSAKNSGICFLTFLFFVAGFASFLQNLVTYGTTEFAVTDKRVIAKTGFLRRRSLELMLNKIESIQVNQSILGRMFDYGALVVVGTGGTKEAFPNIAKPMEFRKRINTQIAGATM